MSLLRMVGLRGMAGGIFLGLLGGWDGGNMEEIKGGGHVFRGPRGDLIKEELPWLPTGQPEHLRFVINPEAPLQEQMSVGVDPSPGTCQPSAPPASNMLEWACKLGQGGSNRVQGAFKPEKVFDRPDDKTHWGYKVPDGAGGYREVAGCYALSDGKTGLCRSINSYKDLIYSVGFRDEEITRLPEIWTKVDELLSSWEKPAH